MRQHLSKKIAFLNQTALDSLKESDELKIIKNFTDAGIKVLTADFGFGWFKRFGRIEFELAYKSPKLPYTPSQPRKGGINYKVLHSRLPYFAAYPKKETSPKYDVTPYMNSYVILPISYRNKTYGNIVICFKQRRVFTKEDRDLCIFIGNSTAQAITIYRLHANLKKARHNLEERVKERTKELRESYQKLEEDRAKDEAVFSSIGEGMMVTDADGKVILLNPEGERILGHKKELLLEKNLFEHRPLYDETGSPVATIHQPVYHALAKGKHTKKNSSSYIYYIDKPGKNHPQTPISITATPIISNNKITGAVEVFRDVTAEREMDRAKSELISLASHQLRTPLSAINWYTEVLIKEEVGQLSETQKKYLKEVYDANKKMVELVYDFLNVSRMELGTFSIKLTTVNLTDITQSILKEIKPLINNKKLQVTERLGRNLPPVQMDRKVVRLILQNLITNSVKYTPPKGSISIDVSVKKKANKHAFLSIVVADTGYGIPKKLQPKVFTKLFRGDNTAKLDTEGSGLGLYLVKSFVDYCKGKITFKSAEHKGTTFFVTLPVTIPDPNIVDKQPAL